jgi:predicted chitinase
MTDSKIIIMPTVEKVDRASFFKKIKVSLFGKLSQLQVDTINAVLDECEAQGVDNKIHIAYIFATAYHECHKPNNPELRLTPMVEFGSMSYLKGKKYYPYIGRGLVQLTWLDNYQKIQKVISTLDRFKGVDIVTHPDKVLDPKLSAFVIVYGMRKGTFTGKKLSDYKTFVPMRRIINGIDKANLIASYANSFLTALQ